MFSSTMANMVVMLVMIAIFQVALGPPVDKNKAAEDPQAQQNDTDWNLGLEYNKYLQEVVQILESDPEFRQKLESAKVDEIRDGTIAKELESLNHHVRSKLDEVKRMEIERLRKLAQQQYEMSQGMDRKHMKIPKHIEFKSANFEVADLQKLIKQTTDDLEEADKQRREEFKKYEMEKKFEKDQRLNAINDTLERKEVQEEMEKMEAKHNKHEKLNHPMTKDQLEEVWEDQDHMDPQDWNPKTFFAMHDLDGNGQWDENEVRVLFKKELDKAYDPNAPEDDMREREEEMERMREHVFKESDSNKDRLISYDEFLAETQKEEFEKDPGWDTLDEGDDDLYTDEEFQNFEHEREAEVRKMMAAGQLPPGYAYPNIPAMPPVGYGHHPAMGQMGGPQYVPQQMQYAPPMPGVDRNGVPMHGSVPGQQANPNFAPGQLPPQQFAGQPQQYGGQGQQFAQQQFAQPPQFAGQQQQFGQPQQMGGQPQQMGGQPQQMGGQPQQMGGQPQQMGGQPQQMGGQPLQMRGQPLPVGGQQQQMGGQPQPMGGQQQPVGQPRPVGGQPQPAAGQPQPVAGQPQPAAGQQQPVADQQQQVNVGAPVGGQKP